jgi:transposase-like protein
VVNTRQGERQKRTLDERSPGSHDQVERNPRQRRNGEQEERGRGGGEAPTDEQSRFMVIDETGGDLEGEQEGNGERDREREREEREREERAAEEERERERLRKEREEFARLDEFALGDVFKKIDEKMCKELEELIGKEEDDVSRKVRACMKVVLEGMRGVMNTVSEIRTQERSSRAFEEVEVNERIEKVKEEVKSLNRVAEHWKEEESIKKIKQSEAEMESKVRCSNCQLKLLDLDFGYATDDKKEMVRQVVSMLRSDVAPSEKSRLDRILRRTRIVLLGKRTELRKERNGNIHNIPVLLEMQNKADTDDMDMMLRQAGYFPAFHWPSEMMEFIEGARDVLRREGYGDSYFVRIRPEEKGGEMQIRADVKKKNGGKFTPKAFWKCPPLQKAFWPMITNLYEPRLVGQREEW